MENEMEKTRKIMPFGLRLQPDLKKWIEHQAELSKRSINSEIAFRLEKSKAEQENAQH